MIECVTLENSHKFSGNPLYSQHRLRYESIIKRQNWDVPYVRHMEYDSYDNPVAYYLVKRNVTGQAIGVSRLYPTTRPYMLEEHFPYLITKTDIPKDIETWETTRFCVDSTLDTAERKRVLHELVVSHLEFALKMNIKNIIAVTYPVFWKNIFISSGWNVEWLGDVHKSDEGFKIIAGRLAVSEEVLTHVRHITGIDQPILNFGEVGEVFENKQQQKAL
ncbi:MAG: acyl-homoserine-lactone synthase [Alphaproteobacteria bacterium]